MKKYILLGIIFLSGLVLSMLGCCTGDYYLIKKVDINFTFPHDTAPWDYHVKGDTLIMSLYFSTECTAQKSGWNGFDQNSYAFQCNCGQGGLKDDLVDFKIFASTEINGIPAGNNLEPMVQYMDSWVANKDSLMNLMNNGKDINACFMSMVGTPADSLLTFSFLFSFASGEELLQQTDTLTWAP